MKDLRLIVTSMADLMENAVTIALQYNISAYDASYVALSKQVNAPLLTLDKRLVRTLLNSQYQVINFHDFVVLSYFEIIS